MSGANKTNFFFKHSSIISKICDFESEIELDETLASAHTTEETVPSFLGPELL